MSYWNARAKFEQQLRHRTDLTPEQKGELWLAEN